jgi:iduronate 2-sulfatase
LPKPPNVSGQSIAKLLKNPKANWDLPAYSVTEYRKSLGKSVRTARWHYVEWDEGKSGAMLYEHPKDPLELKNLADDPNYAKVVAKMKRLLAKMPQRK